MSIGLLEITALLVSLLIFAGLGYGVFILVRRFSAAIARRIRR